ncbi:MAG TPA: hypothetical protein VGB94_12890, partial [Acidobacteriaceae bacterium]
MWSCDDVQRSNTDRTTAEGHVQKWCWTASKNMLTKRIIACLDVRGGRVVKGVQFVDIIDAG